jgi:uncharacterized protein YuzE
MIKENKMKLKYIKDTDTFYIILSDKKSIESEEITDGVVADFDSDGNLVGFEILAAKGKINFHDLLIDSLPFENMNFMRETTTT